MSGSEKISYLEPRAPSITCWNDRVKLPGPVSENLLKFKMDDSDDFEDKKLKVYLRIKPCQVEFNPYRVVNDSLEAEAPKDSIPYKKLSKNVGKLMHKFHFTSIFKPGATQEDVFKKCVLRNLERFINGENDLLFAYGTTNAGKTFTMQGTADRPGVIPRAMQFVFRNLKDKIEPSCEFLPYRHNELCRLNEDEIWKEHVHKNFILNLDLTKYLRHPEISYKSYRTETTVSSSGFSEIYENETFRDMESKIADLKYEVENNRYSLWISMIEIYNENVYDLLDVPDEKDARMKLGFAEDENGKVYIKNLRYVHVTSGHEAFQVFEFGKANLRFGPTALNNASSRSHCICTLTLARFLDCEKPTRAVMSRISFCDLAGIERAKKALIEGQRLVESKSINTSLSIFVKCLTVIRENQSLRGKKIVPYRESKLTRLFRDAMMGKEKFSIIVNITPEPHLFSETINVLKFSAVAQQIVPVNVFPKVKTLCGRKSKFASVVANTRNNSEINWESGNVIQKNETIDRNALEDLMDLVDNLRLELEEERDRANNIERKVREELSNKFSQMLNSQYETNRLQFESETQRLQEMFNRKERRLIEYFEKKRGKRRKTEEDCEDYEELENEIETLRKEVLSLKAENSSLKELIQKINTGSNELQMRCTQMELEMCEKDRMLRAHEKSRETNGDEVVKELESQLKQSKSKITELKGLLDESAFDYRDLLETNKQIKDENERLLHELATTSSVMEDLKNELHEYQKMLSLKTEEIENLEDKLDQVKESCEDENPRLADLEKLLKECETGKLQALRQLRIAEEKMRVLSNNVKEMEGEKEKWKLEAETLKNKINGQTKREVADSDSEYENDEIDNSNDIVGSLRKMNENLKAKCSEQDEEIRCLQKEIKSLMNRIQELNKDEERITMAKELTEKNVALMEELDRCKKNKDDLMKQFEEEKENWEKSKGLSEMVINNLREKLESAECQTRVVKSMKDEAEKAAARVPELTEQIAALEKEISEMEKKIEILESHKEELVDENKNEINKLKEENKQLQRENALMSEKIETLKKDDGAEMSRLKQLLQKAEEELESLKAETENKSPGEMYSVKDDNSRVELLQDITSQANKEPPPRLGAKERDKYSEHTPDRLSKEIEKLSIFYSETKKSSRKLVDTLDESVHPSMIKSCGRGKAGKEKKKTKKVESGDAKEESGEPKDDEKVEVSEKKKKVRRKLHVENDFDEIGDLETSFTEPEIPRLRPRRK